MRAWILVRVWVTLVSVFLDRGNIAQIITALQKSHGNDKDDVECMLRY
jgi:hypothetical protein